MKKTVFLAVSVIVLCIMAGCKKDDPAPSIVGFWTGNYNGSVPYAALFRSNGTVRVFANDADTLLADSAEGTYTVTDSVRATYDDGSNMYSMAGNLNTSVTSMTGTWGIGTSTAGGGSILLSR
jgi:hypothetical protein